MKPTPAAARVRGSTTRYLTTTYAPAEEDTRTALERLPGHSETEILRGPFLRSRPTASGPSSSEAAPSR